MTETHPIRVQRRRAKGWKMPPNTIYVGRPGPWGNRHALVVGLTAREAVDRYREDVTLRAGTVARIQNSLRGKNLACWCPLHQACHADVLLEIANAPLNDQQQVKP